MSVVIGRLRSILFVFHGPLAVAIIMIDGSEKNAIVSCILNFRVCISLLTVLGPSPLMSYLLRVQRPSKFSRSD